MKNNLKQQENFGGRKIGSRNKLTPKAKENLFNVFNEDIQNFHKSYKYLDWDEKFTKIRSILKLLCVGDDEVSKETRRLIFESLQPEFLKLKLYFYQIPHDKRAVELRQYLNFLDKEQIEIIFTNIKR